VSLIIPILTTTAHVVIEYEDGEEDIKSLADEIQGALDVIGIMVSKVTMDDPEVKK